MTTIAEWLEGKTITSGPDDMIMVTDGADFLRLVPRSEDNQHYRDIAAASLVPAIEEPTIDLVAYAADRRWRQEVGGIEVSGVPVATDDRSKLMIIGARVAAAVDPAWSTVWNGADGNIYPIDAAAMIEISDEVQAHVNKSFATFAAVKADIEAGDITTTAEIDARFAA